MRSFKVGQLVKTYFTQEFINARSGWILSSTEPGWQVGVITEIDIDAFNREEADYPIRVRMQQEEIFEDGDCYFHFTLEGNYFIESMAEAHSNENIKIEPLITKVLKRKEQWWKLVQQ